MSYYINENTEIAAIRSARREMDANTDYTTSVALEEHRIIMNIVAGM